MSSSISSTVSPLSLPGATSIRTAVEYIETAKRPKATPTARQGSHKQVEAAADDIPRLQGKLMADGSVEWPLQRRTPRWALAVDLDGR
uniref:Uncharacterized protein n=1 Tax=Oryza meridionalis TaxID=40149 RepID=A0A0E0D925_9ORYZ